jgi:hypothetical protein
METLAALRPGVLGIVRQMEHSKQRAAARAAGLRERARRALRVAYVAAREMSEDPRAIALASTAAVVVTVFLVTSATRNPLTDDEVKTALRILYAPRRAYRFVRRYASSGRELGEFLDSPDPCVHAYALLRRIDSLQKRGKEESSDLWVRASDHTAYVPRAHAHRERELHRDRVRK